MINIVAKGFGMTIALLVLFGFMVVKFQLIRAYHPDITLIEYLFLNKQIVIVNK